MPGVTWQDADPSSKEDVDSLSGGNEAGVVDDLNDDEISRMTPETNKAESLYDGASTTKGGSSVNDDSGTEEAIGGRETTQVTYLRALVLLVLFCAAGAVSTTVYLATTRAATEQFETAYDGVAAKVLETFEEIVSEKLAALSAFSVATTSYARAQEAEFPFVTQNDFQQRAGSIREVVDCLLVYTIYKVVAEQRNTWEQYTVNTTDWYFNDLAYQKERGINIGDYPFMPFIFSFNASLAPVYEALPTNPQENYYAAIWQSSPLFPSFPNFNVKTFPPYGPAVTTALETGNMAIGRILTASPGDAATSQDISTVLYAVLLGAQQGKNVTYNGDPMAYVALPIFDSFDAATRQTVGTVSAIMNWATYFQGVVPPQSKPITIVLANACDGPYTYEADNNQVTFKGQGDLHDPAYAHLGRRANLNALVARASAGRVYNAFELEELDCPYHVQVYPTRSMEEDHKTSIPLITTTAVAAVFVFTAAVFLLYNHIVEQRQRVVLNQATQSTQLVSTFLPTEVQKRLLKDDKGNGGSGGKHVSSISRLKTFFSEGEDKDAKPIADLFPFCTVLFAE